MGYVAGSSLVKHSAASPMKLEMSLAVRQLPCLRLIEKKMGARLKSISSTTTLHLSQDIIPGL